jgi:hypothetical protein
MTGSRLHPFVVIGTPNTSAPLDTNASIDLADTDKGLLPNRLTTAQRNAIVNPTAGLTVYNTDTNRLETWTGSSWTQDATTGALLAANNLGDVANAATARTNLGLGSAATQSTSAFDAAGAAASAQAAAEAASDPIGSATTVQAASLQKSANLSDVASASTARTNLGLGSAATHAATDFDAAGAATAAQASSLQKTANLFDVASATTARANLGFVDGAVVINKTFDAATVGTVPAGTMVSLTRTGTIIDKVAPVGNTASLTTLSASTSSTICPCDMGNQTFVVGYLDTTNGSAITLVACLVSGSTILAGSPVVVSASTSGTFHICKLSSTLGVIVYNDTTNASTQTAVAFSLSGTAISLGVAQTTSASTDTTGGFYLCKTSSATFLLLFNDSANSSHLSVVAGSVSGTTISVGSLVQVSASTYKASTTGLGVLTSASFVIALDDSTNGNKPAIVADAISGNVISFGTISQQSSMSALGTNAYLFCAVLDNAHFVAFTPSQAVFGVVSGTTVTVGTAITFSGAFQLGSTSFADIPRINYALVDSTHAYLSTGAYLTATGDTTGTITTTRFNGSASNSIGLFLNSSLAVRLAGSSLFGAAASSATFTGSTGSFSAIYSPAPRFGNTAAPTIFSSSTSCIVVGQISGTGVTAELVTVYDPGNPNTVGLYGLTTQAGSAGQTVPVVTSGIVTGLSGLTQDTQVFAQGDGTLNTSGIGIGVGYAFDSQTVLLRKGQTTSSIPVVLTP